MSVPLLVADSGPLIALVRLNLLALPARLFPQVLVSATVWAELTNAPRPGEGAAFVSARAAGHFNVVADSRLVVAGLKDSRLDVGELSALTLAVDLQAAVLIDERKGRATAATLGLPVIGTLGLLLRARERGWIGPVRPMTATLTASGYFLSRELVDSVLSELGE
jgi:predicted nucleic acid-binding protein